MPRPLQAPNRSTGNLRRTAGAGRKLGSRRHCSHGLPHALCISPRGSGIRATRQRPRRPKAVASVGVFARTVQIPSFTLSSCRLYGRGGHGVDDVFDGAAARKVVARAGEPLEDGEAGCAADARSSILYVFQFFRGLALKNMANGLLSFICWFPF